MGDDDDEDLIVKKLHHVAEEIKGKKKKDGKILLDAIVAISKSPPRYREILGNVKKIFEGAANEDISEEALDTTPVRSKKRSKDKCNLTPYKLRNNLNPKSVVLTDKALTPRMAASNPKDAEKDKGVNEEEGEGSEMDIQEEAQRSPLPVFDEEDIIDAAKKIDESTAEKIQVILDLLRS